MSNDPLVALVISEVSAPLAEDGGRADLIAVKDGVARVAYHKGRNDDCPECIMSVADMREYISEALSGRAPYIREVEIVEG